MLSNVSGVGWVFCKACNGISSPTACPYVAALAQRLRRMAQSKGQISKILDTLHLKPRGCFVRNCFLKELMCMTQSWSCNMLQSGVVKSKRSPVMTYYLLARATETDRQRETERHVRHHSNPSAFFRPG